MSDIQLGRGQIESAPDLSGLDVVKELEATRKRVSELLELLRSQFNIHCTIENDKLVLKQHSTPSNAPRRKRETV